MTARKTTQALSASVRRARRVQAEATESATTTPPAATQPATGREEKHQGATEHGAGEPPHSADTLFPQRIWPD